MNVGQAQPTEAAPKSQRRVQKETPQSAPVEPTKATPAHFPEPELDNHHISKLETPEKYLIIPLARLPQDTLAQLLQSSIPMSIRVST